MNRRFTIDGSAQLEEHLGSVCAQVAEEARRLVGPRKLEGLVLGGGYGRGEGGVLRTESGDLPYNDLEFYVFLRGNRLLNDCRLRSRLDELGERLSRTAGLHVEFKIESLARLRESPITMFSYDLVSGHKAIAGGAGIFAGCAHHLQAAQIPASEAARLLFNRCTGLLLARERLLKGSISPEDANFIGRNLAKAKLALGDAVLTVCGQYNWSCRERHRRLERLCVPGRPPGMEDIEKIHAEGVDFKLHPRATASQAGSLESEYHRVSRLAGDLWLWLEARRLKCDFETVRDYAFCTLPKWPGSNCWRNYLLNFRTFGAAALRDSMANRYPRERLCNTLALLLWDEQTTRQSEVTRHIQKQLRTNAVDWSGLVEAYKRIWPAYG